MRIKPFHFQKFTIRQRKDVFAVGTDGVLLGALANLKNARRVLEVGTGTGLISLMLAQRFPEISILAIDLQPEAAVLARENFQNSPFSDRLTAEQENFSTGAFEEKFEAIICNPPFFLPNSSEKLVSARQQRTLTLENLIEKSAEILTAEGILQFIYPSGEQHLVEKLAGQNELFLTEIINIYGVAGGKTVRQIFTLSGKNQLFRTTDFIIEDAPRQYSAQYLAATRDFHLFSKK